MGVGDQRESTKEILVGYQSNTCCHKLGVGLPSGTVTSDAPNLAQIIILDGWDDPDDSLASYWSTGFRRLLVLLDRYCVLDVDVQALQWMNFQDCPGWVQGVSCLQ